MSEHLRSGDASISLFVHGTFSNLKLIEAKILYCIPYSGSVWQGECLWRIYSFQTFGVKILVNE